MQTATHSHIGGANTTASILVGLVLFAMGVSGLWGQELEPNRASDRRALLDNPLADWGPNYTNWVEISAGALINGRDSRESDGWRAEVQRRHVMRADVFGGVESLHFEQPIDKKTRLLLDGRGIFDNHDYDLRLEVRRDELGFVRGGFREFRTWYDRHGGFYPNGGIWITPFDREAALDRGEIFFEAGLRKPDVPEVTFRYAHSYRNGIKDSTTWGDYNLNIGTTNAADLRNLVPAFWEIDETRDSFALDARHTVGKTAFGVGVRYDLIEQDNARKIVRRPGEVPPLVARGFERRVTQREGVDTDLFNAHAFVETRFSDTVLFTMGGAFTTLDTDISGSRIYGLAFDAVYDPLFGRRQQRDEGFLNLTGGGRVDQYLVNLNLHWTPFENFSITPSLRFQAEKEDADSNFIETDFGAAPIFTAIRDPLSAFKDSDFIEVAEALEARYTGLTNWVLYARGEWTEGDRDLRETEIDLLTSDETVFQDKNIDRLTQKYVAGLNWYPLRRLNFSGQYYHKIHTVDYESRLGPPPSTYPGFLQEQDFEVDDMNFRVTVRPLNTVSLVSRYDFQLATIDTAGDQLGKAQSAETTSHIFSESVSWTPVSWLYLQGNLNYSLDDTETPANYLTGAARNLVLKAENDYWNASLMAGLTLDEKTSLQLQYYYYRADNYRTANLAPVAGAISLLALPYGAGAEENGVTATLTRQLTRALRITLKYGFFANNDETYGGHKDYEAHLVYSSLQYRF